MFTLSNFGSTQVKAKEILSGAVPTFLQAFIKSLVFNPHITCERLPKYFVTLDRILNTNCGEK
jgi:hypothetical protein